jgi:hypothetical protein
MVCSEQWQQYSRGTTQWYLQPLPAAPLFVSSLSASGERQANFFLCSGGNWCFRQKSK